MPTHDDAPEPDPPFDLGKFYLLGRIGEGGSGAVYAAQVDGQLVALKVLRREVALTEREQKAFFSEAEKMRRVAHPSLVPVLDVGALPDGRPYLVMPRLLGEPLSTRLQRGPIAADAQRAGANAPGVLPYAHTLALFEGLAQGVSALHRAGLVHRDIKPENIFVVAGPKGREREEERLVLLDLGIAREIGAPSSTTTQQGLVRGTPAYMAPERFFGARASVATDLYELAVVLFMMLTGGLPWSPDDPKQRLTAITPDALGAMLPAAFARLFTRALSMTASERPESPEELCAEARRAAESARPSSSGLGPGSIQITPPRAAPLARSEIASLGANETVAATPFTLGASADTASKPKRSQRGAIAFVAAAVILAIGVGVWARARMADDARASLAATTALPSASAPAIPVEPAPPTSASASPESSAAPLPSAPRAPTRPTPSTQPNMPAPILTGAQPAPAPGGSSGPIPSCQRVLALYCSPAWRATERGSAGSQCASFQGVVRAFEQAPSATHADSEKTCAAVLAQGQAVLAERQRQIDAGVAPAGM
jgi:serine/threonine-protein kinase